MIRLLETTNLETTGLPSPGKKQREVDANPATNLLVRGDISPVVHLREE